MHTMRGGRLATRVKMPMRPAMEMLCSLAKILTSDVGRSSRAGDRGSEGGSARRRRRGGSRGGCRAGRRRGAAAGEGGSARAGRSGRWSPPGSARPRRDSSAARRGRRPRGLLRPSEDLGLLVQLGLAVGGDRAGTGSAPSAGARRPARRRRRPSYRRAAFRARGSGPRPSAAPSEPRSVRSASVSSLEDLARRPHAARRWRSRAPSRASPRRRTSSPKARAASAELAGQAGRLRPGESGPRAAVQPRRPRSPGRARRSRWEPRNPPRPITQTRGPVTARRCRLGEGARRSRRAAAPSRSSASPPGTPR